MWIQVAILRGAEQAVHCSFSPHRMIDLKNAKVTPSEVYLDDKGSTEVDGDVISNKTFLIL